jgi:hypothetical protein
VTTAAGRLGIWALAIALELPACGGNGGQGKAPPGQPVATIDVRETDFELDVGSRVELSEQILRDHDREGLSIRALAGPLVDPRPSCDGFETAACSSRSEFQAGTG